MQIRWFAATNCHKPLELVHGSTRHAGAARLESGEGIAIAQSHAAVSRDGCVRCNIPRERGEGYPLNPVKWPVIMGRDFKGSAIQRFSGSG